MTSLSKTAINEAKTWRRYLHARPELAFQEFNTAHFVAEKLREFGWDVHAGIAGTGVVSVIGSGESGRSVGLRADMDALPIQEANTFAHRSKHDNCMHACGHDGHVAMLLTAARELALNPPETGQIFAIFQPAEEGAGGGAAMIEDGLFEKFPMEAVFGLHNVPALEAGKFATRHGPIMAAFDTFDLELHGAAGHAAFPQDSSDVIVALSAVVSAVQTIISRDIAATDVAVLSVTAVEAGNSYNVLPASGRIKGAIRSYDSSVRSAALKRVKEIASGVAHSYNLEVSFSASEIYPATVNTEKETDFALSVVKEIFGEVNGNFPMQLASEDFAFMLQERPGCYMLIGNGSSDGGCLLHSKDYDFNDDIIESGAKYWVELARSWLAKETC